MFTMLTSLSHEEALILAKKGKCMNVDNMPQIMNDLLNEVAIFMKNNVGYESIPVCCISKIGSGTVSIAKNNEDIDDYLEVGAGSILLELNIKEDMCVSIEFTKLLEFNSQYKNCLDYEREFILEEFYTNLMIGKIDGNDVITFVPFLDIKTARWFMMLNEDWDTESTKLGNVPEYKVNKMLAFE